LESIDEVGAAVTSRVTQDVVTARVIDLIELNEGLDTLAMVMDAVVKDSVTCTIIVTLTVVANMERKVMEVPENVGV
jgi:hypothetical protein